MPVKYINEFAKNYILPTMGVAKGGFTIADSNRDKKQKKTSITQDIKKYLNTAYEKHGKKLGVNFSFLNKYEDINYEGELELDNDETDFAYKELYADLRDNLYESKIQFNKYRRYKLISIGGGSATFEYVDSMGNIKQKKESVLLLKKYLEENKELVTFTIDREGLMSKITAGKKVKFVYKITNNINEKLKVIHMNKVWNSCQAKIDWIKEGEYARGLYDFFNNGCIAPLIVYQDGKIVARSAFRIFYDSQGKRYINLERVFGHGYLIDKLDIFTKKITEQLLKLNETLTVSERFTVTNTYKQNPWFVSLKNSNKFKLERLTKNLRQPKRLVNPKINQGYYQDSRIHTIMPKSNIGKPNKYVYDSIDPSEEFALHTITLNKCD